ncbi:hypothetical protein SORBI_3004G132200 [Sorghum bicolor]|uniref:Uncharacterized protein n=1 Tax=Sorghum bicolor TaxID=4558 RepID=A0A194YPG1_SORBI|nr:hypothetical protein SORBI_3004G132200 [Sorghum bicolor]
MRRANMVLLLAVGFLMLASDAVALKKVCTSKKIPPQGKACDPKTCHENAKKDFTAGGARCPDHSSCYVQGHCVAGGCQRIVCAVYVDPPSL